MLINKARVRTQVAKRRDKGEERRIARQRVQHLFDLAGEASLGPDGDLASRYTSLARRVAMKYQLQLTRAQKTQLCRNCNAFRVPGRTSRTRLQKGRIITTCLSCGTIHRRPLAPKSRSP